MNVKLIEEKTYEELLDFLSSVAQQIKELCDEHQGINQQWLDNQDVCQLLSISKRTLQYYRDSGTIPFSMIGNKCYYKVSDIEEHLRKSEINNGYGNN